MGSDADNQGVAGVNRRQLYLLKIKKIIIKTRNTIFIVLSH